ncbi:MAG TPA: hypothetical protein ENJ18_19280 [Nannocystis exedens]|nr:hypothetical protein [Nannocystis exedens]
MCTRPWQAVIDVGTNTSLLLLARRAPDGALEVAEDRATITRLGEGVAATGALSTVAIGRTLDALRAYRRAADKAGATIQAVTTEGVRLARNPDDFLLPASAILGVPVEVISGAKEAHLSYLSVAREIPGTGPLRVVDIGGASTELVIGEGLRVLSAVSHRIGSVRLTERFRCVGLGDRPAAAEIAAMHDAAREALSAQPLPAQSHLHGLAGTVTTAAALLLGLDTYTSELVDNSEHSLSVIVELRDRLASQTLEERVGPVLERRRADVIVAGLTILLAVMEHCGAQVLVVRDRGLRYALIT